MRIAATFESVEALREFADSVPYAIGSIRQDTETFKSAYASLRDDLGSRADNLQEIVDICAKAVDEAAEGIEFLPDSLNQTADLLEKWLLQHLSISAGIQDGSSNTSGSPRIGQKVKSSYHVTKR